MSNKINSLKDLKLEIAVLQTKQAVQQDQLKSDIKSLTESLRPANLIRNAIKSFGTDSGLRGDMTRKGAEAAVGFLISNLLLKNFGPAAKTLAALAGTTVATSVLGEHAEKYIGKFKDLIEKFKKKSGAEGDNFDEKDIYS